MARRSRLRRGLKYLGTAVSALVLTAFIVSTRRAVMYDSLDVRREWGLVGGAVTFAWRPPGWRLDREQYAPRPGWTIAKYGGTCHISWWIERSCGNSWQWCSIPLWMPFAALATPTAALWWLDRRRFPPDHCKKCDYNLTGNVSGRCPECGTSTTTPTG